MLNAVVGNKQQAIMALFRLQSMGISDDQILNMAQQLNNGQQHIPYDIQYSHHPFIPNT